MLDRQTTLELARLLDEVVVSDDRIGSTYHDDAERVAQERYAYHQEIEFWRRASTLRGRLFDALWAESDLTDDESVIAHDARVEAELASRYWRAG